MICDGHDSHVSVAFVCFCMTHNIWILLLPPHSSHLLQPLDVGIFGPLKKALSVQSDKLFRSGLARIQKVEWLESFAKARAIAMRPDNVDGAWRGASLFPFYPHRILRKFPIPTPPISPKIEATTSAYLLNSSPTNALVLQAASTTVIDKIDSSNLSPATKNSIRHFTTLTQKLQAHNSITTKENENLREAMGKRKERMSTKRHVLKGQVSICLEENVQKLETAESATKKRKKNKGSHDANGGRQKYAKSRNTVEISEEQVQAADPSNGRTLMHVDVE